MDEKTFPSERTADSLKDELRESLKILRADFGSLRHFVDEVSSNSESAATITLTRDDLDALLSVTQEIRDAANDIEFEATKIKEILSRLKT